MISRPLLVLSIANALSDHSEFSSFPSDDSENSPSADYPQLGSEDISGPPSLQCSPNTRYIYSLLLIFCIHIAKDLVINLLVCLEKIPEIIVRRK